MEVDDSYREEIKYKEVAMKKLIINADDFGYDKETCDRTIELFELSLITSATIMTGMPASERAIDFAAKNSEKFSFGLHFNIVDGHLPLSNAKSSLTDEMGTFWPSNKQRINALLGKIADGDIAKEFEAQLNVLIMGGVKVSHFDSHGHLHKFPHVINSLQGTMDKYGIHVVRRPQNLYQVGSLNRRILNWYCSLSFRKFSVPDSLFAIESHTNMWHQDFFKLLPEGITELAIHPGWESDWRRVETTPLMSGVFSNMLAEHGVSLTNFADSFFDK